MSLKVEHLVKSFGEKRAVDDLSFTVDGGVFGLIGTNGAGKTTTIRIALGVMNADSGTALWNGKKVTRETVRFGYMPEERGIYPKVKIGEQLVYFSMLRGMSKSDAVKSMKEWLVRLGVEEYENVIAEKLSKGNQQKIQLISALIHDPELIFLDEPFSGLDPINTDIFKRIIGELVEAGKSIVMSSHQMATVEEYCENLVILDKGKTIVSGNLRQIKSGYGHTNLSVRCSDDDKAAALAEKRGLVLLEEAPDYNEYKITGDEMANNYLHDLVGTGLFIERFEIREPSLHEIFIEKVGKAASENA